MVDNKMPRHPMQPTVQDDRGVLRFKQNAIVRFLLDAGPFNLEKLATMPFSDEDRAQFAQLIGYSVGGYSDLTGDSPIADDRYRAAMDRTRHTTLSADEILAVLDLYLDRARDDFAAFVALQGFRGAITGGADLAALLAYFEEPPLDQGPKTNTYATCAQCGNDIVFVGPYWDHVGELKPKHPAIPQMPSPVSGLMPAEQRTMDALLAAWEAFKAIPESVPDTEVQKFRDAIHDAQYVLASLVIRRLYPDYWR